MTTVRSSSKKQHKFILESAEQRAAWTYLATVFLEVRGSACGDVNALREPTLQDYTYMVPNGTQLAGTGKRRAIQMANLKSQGLRPGVSDMVIAYPVKGYHGAYIELKRTREAYGGPAAIKSAIRPAQIVWLRRMQSVGYWVGVAYGAWEFKACVEMYLRGECEQDLDFLRRPE